jgi:hypothetical protein
MPPKSVWKIVEYIKHEYEEWGGDPQIDEASLYRHVEEMLDLEREPPELAPAEIVEKEVRLIFCVEVEVIDTVDNETTRGTSDLQRRFRPQRTGPGLSFATSLESIHQPATRTATWSSSTGCFRCDAATSSSSCRRCPDPRPRVEWPAPPADGAPVR